MNCHVQVNFQLSSFNFQKTRQLYLILVTFAPFCHTMYHGKQFAWDIVHILIR